MAIQGIIFDMDGLLLDTERLSQKILANLCSSWGYKVEQSILLATIGHNHQKTTVILQDHYGSNFPASQLLAEHEQRMNLYMAAQPPVLKEGVQELVPYLAQRNIPLAIATSSPTARARRAIGLAELDAHFYAIIGGDMVQRPKPHPEIYLKGIAALELPAQQIMAFEDSLVGARAARAAGLLTILIPDMIQYLPEDLQEMDGVYSSLSAARPHLERLLESAE